MGYSVANESGKQAGLMIDCGWFGAFAYMHAYMGGSYGFTKLNEGHPMLARLRQRSAEDLNEERIFGTHMPFGCCCNIRVSEVGMHRDKDQ